MSDITHSDMGRRAAERASRSRLEQVFVASAIAALIVQLFLKLFAQGWLEALGSAAGMIGQALPYALLVIAAAALFRIVSTAGKPIRLAGNRLATHVVAWLVVALLILALTLIGDAAAPLLDFLGKSGQIIIDFCKTNGLVIAPALLLVAAGLMVVGSIDDRTVRPGRAEQLWVQNISAKLAGIPMALTAMVIFVGATFWTVFHSFTNSKLLPNSKLVGLDQYERLWGENRWLISIENLAIYGACSLVLSLVIGFVLAALIDQKIRFENTFRTIFLYPFALSFIVTGLVWQWILAPEFGVQRIVRDLGFPNFTFDPLYNADTVIYGILIAGLWQGTGLIMCLMLAGLRGIDEDIWKAARVDGIPMWKTYLFIVIPMMRPVFITTIVLIASGIVRVYDLVVAQTSGGPGIASEVPAKYVYDKMFLSQNLGQGFAASTMMLVAVVPIVAIWAYIEFGGRKSNG